MTMRPLAALFLSAGLALGGCAGDLPESSLDCESCDVDFGDMQASSVPGLTCLHDQVGTSVTCYGGGLLDEDDTFEATITLYAAPGVPSNNSFDVDEPTLRRGLHLSLGSDYVAGSTYALSLNDGSYYLAAADDWIPFEETLIIEPGQGAPASEVVDNFSSLGLMGDVAEYEAFAFSLPFDRWPLVVIGDGEAVELDYGIGEDSSIGLILGGKAGTQRTALILDAAQEIVELGLAGSDSTVELSGPSVLKIDRDENGNRTVRVATDADLNF